MDPARLRRNAPYPSIRVSYHPQHMDLKILIAKILKMQRAGFSVGAFAIKHPGFKKEIIETEKQCHSLGIDFRTKEFLGVMNGKLYGTYRYRGAVLDKSRKRCLCRTSEFIIAPDGNIYRCHHDLYNNASALGNLLDRNLKIRDIFRGCTYFGHCNPCDVKIKTDRFQVYGHTSVEIKNIRVLP